MRLAHFLGNFEGVGAQNLWRVEARLEVSNVIVTYSVIIVCESLLSGQVLVPPPSTTPVLRVEDELPSDCQGLGHFLVRARGVTPVA